jgi:hypothetical protein
MDNIIMSTHFKDVIFPLIRRRQQDFIEKDGIIPTALIIMDGHPTRRLKSLWEIASENNIDVHIIPAHTSHLIQPLDRCVFAALKRFDSITM